MSKPKNMTPEQEDVWREKVREQNRKYREANAEKRREQRRKYREANPEKIRELKRKWYKANPEKNREKSRKWQKANATQNAADQFFVMAGAAESLTNLIAPKQKTRKKKQYDSNTDT